MIITDPPAARPQVHEVIVDTDCGIDDALALLYLAGRPDVRIAGITAVYGNCTVDDAVRNIGHVLRLAGIPDTPVARGATGPLVGEAHIAHYVHGRDGLGDVVPPEQKADPAVLLDVDSPTALINWALADPGRHTLITLGPLTNVGRALEREPMLLKAFRQVVVMGGSGPFPPVGTALMVDANVQNDGEAARRMFAAPCHRRLMVGVNVTRTVVTDEADIAALHQGTSAQSRFAAAILESYVDFYRLAWGRRICPVHDGLAAALAVQPEWITEQITGPVNITFDGFATRAHVMRTWEGAPVAWDIEDAPDSTAVTAVDAQAFLADFLAVLDRGDLVPTST
jgi:purine nucleosidase